MRKNVTISCSILLLTIVLATSCQRVIKDLASPCRLTAWQGLDDGYLRSLQYNNKGLLSLWHEEVPLAGADAYFTVDYGAHNQVSKIVYYDHDVLQYNIVPIYKNGRVTEERWYTDANVLDDDVINTYNSRGLIIKRESGPYAYYASFEYDAIGNATQILVKGTDGTMYDSLIQQFSKPVREPMNAAPGMPYPIPYINYTIDQLKYSAVVEYGFDVDGNPVKVYEQDDQSLLQAGPQDYAVYYDTYNKVSAVENRQVWKYDNCNCDINISKDKSNTNGSRTISATNMQGSPFITIPEMRKRVMSLRAAKAKSK